MLKSRSRKAPSKSDAAGELEPSETAALHRREARDFSRAEFTLDAARSRSIGVLIVGRKGRVTCANEAFLAFLGYQSASEIADKRLAEGLLAKQSDWRLWERAADGHASPEVELEFLAKDGHVVVLRGVIEQHEMARAADSSVRGIFVDVTSERRLQDLSMSAARMEAASCLAAGVAHDFNNLLTVLVGNLYLVADKVRADQTAYENVKRARDAARRGADLSRALLGFARGGDPETSTVDVAKVLRNLVPLLSAAVGSKTGLKTDIAPDVSAVDVNSAQLESVITNLVINARDAIRNNAGGTVSIAVRNREITREPDSNMPSGKYVELSVSDDGCGMPESIAQRAFEPFFTTKPRGVGNGLGLAMVRRFAEQTNGAVQLRTQENVGTTVTCLMPVSSNEAAETIAKTMPLSKLPSGHETILAISRDAEMRVTIAQILGALGYHVVAKSTFDSSSVEVAASSFAAILLDDNTPPDELAEIDSYLQAIKRSVGIIVIGNKTPGLVVDCAQVQKPFNLLDLSKAVRGAIDGA